MQFSGVYTWTDGLRALWLLNRPRTMFAILGVGLIALAIWGLWVSWSAYFSGRPLGRHALPLSMGVLAILIYNFVYVPWKQYSAFRRDRSLRLPVTFEALDEHIAVSSDTVTSKISWSAVSRVLEDKRMYVLADAYSGIANVPKRFLSQAGLESSFRELLRRKGLVV